MKINGLPDNYLKITKESGCYIADYSSKEFDNESVIIPYSASELSGIFKQSRQETEPIRGENTDL